MNPDTNKFEPLTDADQLPKEQRAAAQKLLDAIGSLKAGHSALLRPDGTPVPKHWSVFTVGERVVIKDYTFKVVYIGESNILFEPVGPVVLGKGK
jgi:hypothetical protein